VEERYLVPLKARLHPAELVEPGGVALIAIAGVVERRLEFPAFPALLVSRAIERRAVAKVAILLKPRGIAGNAAGASAELRLARNRRRCGRRRRGGRRLRRGCLLRRRQVRERQHRGHEQQTELCAHLLPRKRLARR